MYMKDFESYLSTSATLHRKALYKFTFTLLGTYFPTNHTVHN